MRSLIAAAVILAPAIAGPAAVVEYGQVVGSVAFYKVDAAGKKAPLANWDPKNIVVYLVPDGHSIEVQVPPAHAVTSQKNAQFAPEVMVVTKGQTVDFPNDDNIDHNVFSFSKAKKFDLGIYPKGESKSVAFDKEGPILLLCSIHENMNGVLFVAPNHLHGLTDAKGKFAVTKVPIGKYKLYAWHKELPESTEAVQVTSVDVKAGKPVRVEINVSALKKQAAK